MKRGNDKRVYDLDESRSWTPGRSCRSCGNMETPNPRPGVEPSSPPDNWLTLKVWQKGEPVKLGIFCSFSCIAIFLGDIHGLAQTPELARQRAIERGSIFPPVDASQPH